MTPPRVRFAPSPTGSLHLGSALAALANAAFARAEGGWLLLRIDDTDRARSSAAALDDILDTLDWLEIRFDDGPRFQGTRDDLYAVQLERLLADEHAYRCFCSEERLGELHERQRAAGLPPRYDGHCRALDDDEVARRRNRGERHVVRLRVPERAFDFVDLVHGDVAAPPGSFDDMILQRSDGGFGYLFASVVDDVDFAISHVLRGVDHLANTPRQLAILRALGARPPAFAHLPLLLGPSGRKLAKRDPLGSVSQLRERGVLPQTVRRYCMELLGQGAVDPLEHGAVSFDLARVPASAPHVDEGRLASLGREDLAQLEPDDLVRKLARHGARVTRRVLPLLEDVRGEHATLQELAQALGPVLERDDAALPLDPVAREAIESLRLILERCDVDTATGASEAVAALREFATERGWGARQVLRPARLALVGQEHGPKLELVLRALGEREAARRVDAALAAAQAAGEARAAGVDTQAAPGDAPVQ